MRLTSSITNGMAASMTADIPTGFRPYFTSGLFRYTSFKPVHSSKPDDHLNSGTVVKCNISLLGKVSETLDIPVPGALLSSFGRTAGVFGSGVLLIYRLHWLAPARDATRSFSGRFQMQRSQTLHIATGYLAISTAKVLFMLSGFAIYFTLPRLLSPADFGNYGVTIGFLSIFNMMLVIGAIQTVSKFVSEQPAMDGSIRSAAMRGQALLGGAVSLCLLFCAPCLAQAFHDPSLAISFRAGAAIPFFYSFYATIIGSLNGRKQYKAQAVLDMTFAVIKTACIIGAAALTTRVEGAVAGFLLTSIVIAGIALVRFGETGGTSSTGVFSLKKLLFFQVSIMVLTLLGHLFLTLDLFIVKAFSSLAQTPESAGYYTSAQTISRIPQVLVVALSLVMYPLISRSTYHNDSAGSRRAIKAAFRFPLIVIAPLAVFLSAFSRDCLAFVYPAPYHVASPALRILAPAAFILALFQLGITIITGSGRPWTSVTITLAGIILHAAACIWLTSRLGLQGAALGSAIGWSMGFIICSACILRRFKTLVSPATLARSLLAGTVTWFAAVSLPFSGLWRPAAGFVFTVTCYWGLLWMMREITVTELADIARKLIPSQHSGPADRVL
jgi:O-antigen/teichoic acid export membrane protein